MNLQIGDNIYFANYKRPFKVIACSNRWAVCTKPFNIKRTVLYTIIDQEKLIRGTHNLIFNCFDFSNVGGCRLCLRHLLHGQLEISYRNRVPYDPLKIISVKRKAIQ